MAPHLITEPVQLQAAGAVPKIIHEYVGRAAVETDQVSIARMSSPRGWSEPGQTPEFDEYTVVLSGMVTVEHRGGTIDVHAGQAVHTPAGEWVRYSTPEGADYIAVCVPAFSPAAVHRDEEA
jgi:quercetin dioxygenase-like cupin family protein